MSPLTNVSSPYAGSINYDFNVYVPTSCFVDHLTALEVLADETKLSCTLNEGTFHATERLPYANNFRPLTALFFFCLNDCNNGDNKPGSLKLLLENGAREFINDRDLLINNQTPLETLFFMNSTDKKNKEIMAKMLLENGAEITEKAIRFAKSVGLEGVLNP